MKTLHVTSLAARRSRVRSQASLATSANDLPRKQKASADPFLPVLSVHATSLGGSAESWKLIRFGGGVASSAKGAEKWRTSIVYRQHLHHNVTPWLSTPRLRRAVTVGFVKLPEARAKMLQNALGLIKWVQHVNDDCLFRLHVPDMGEEATKLIDRYQAIFVIVAFDLLFHITNMSMRTEPRVLVSSPEIAEKAVYKPLKIFVQREDAKLNAGGNISTSYPDPDSCYRIEEVADAAGLDVTALVALYVKVVHG
ncbi:hypothetical protein KC365_g82 [Hortaea werneckii]|nr:hypothetical protein KC365_g82 [Hortaea werneckii]